MNHPQQPATPPHRPSAFDPDATEVLSPGVWPQYGHTPPENPADSTKQLPRIEPEPAWTGEPGPPEGRPRRVWIPVAAIAACAATGLAVGALVLGGDGQEAAPVPRSPTPADGTTPSSAAPSSSDVPSPAPSTPGPVLLGGPYMLISDTGKAADVTAASRDNGAVVIAYQPTGNPNQRWTLTDAGGGYVRITAVHSGKCLQADAAAPAGGVTQQPCAGTDSQQWRAADDGAAYTLTLKGSGQTLGIGPGDALCLQRPGAGPVRKWAVRNP
ncbi:RICIN domain-containing protein [Streptomyces roseoverticillatus]|uniref:RICIN domain-containing protein n=1 Tax=Streptomyces roseoverticillatus TaxID=66429 RepID=UPI0033E6F5BF